MVEVAAGTPVAERPSQIVAHADIQQRRTLGQVAHPAAIARPADGIGRLSAQQQRPLERIDEPRHRAQQGRLATTGRPPHRHDLALVQLQRQAGDQPATADADGELAELKQ